MSLAMQVILARHVVIVVAVRHKSARLIVQMAGIVPLRRAIAATPSAAAPTPAAPSSTVVVMVVMVMVMAISAGADDVVGFTAFHDPFDGQIFDFYA